MSDLKCSTCIHQVPYGCENSRFLIEEIRKNNWGWNKDDCNGYEQQLTLGGLRSLYKRNQLRVEAYDGTGKILAVDFNPKESNYHRQKCDIKVVKLKTAVEVDTSNNDISICLVAFVNEKEWEAKE